MRRVAGILLLAVAISAAPSWLLNVLRMSSEEEVTQPDFCKGYDCPEYAVISTSGVSIGSVTN